MSVQLQYRANRSGTLHAAYLGACRVGYVERRANGTHLWQAIFVRPEGGAYVGKEDDEQSAKDALLKSVIHWIESTGLSR